MTLDPLRGALVWITKRNAVNPANVVAVFHGTAGQLEITLVAGQPIHTSERELTAEGRALLIPEEQDDYAEQLLGR
jgi:hypothetical protein